jgi:hypothetical protein
MDCVQLLDQTTYHLEKSLSILESLNEKSLKLPLDAFNTTEDVAYKKILASRYLEFETDLYITSNVICFQIL